MKQKQQFSVQFEYDVHYTENLFSLENDVLAEVLGQNATKALVVVDAGLLKVFPNLKSNITTWMQAHPENVQLAGEIITLTGGEEVKNNWKVVETISDAVIKEKICRHSFVIIIGGGAILDAVGFGASVAHRGIQQIRIPTTVLSQDDSGVGVKNAINYRGLKNFLGCFDPPYAVINDYAFIRHLPKRDRLSGIAEAVKVALIKDKEFFQYLADHSEQIRLGNDEVMKKVIARSAEIHLQHIGGSGDPFEKGSSRPLDFGHWAAHKLEGLTNYEIRHGEAVIIGVLLDTIISKELGFLTEAECTKITKVIEDCGFTLWHPALEWYDEQGNWRLIQGLADFREHLGGRLTLAMLTGIGQMCNIHELDSNLVQKVLNEMKARYKAL